MMAGNAWIAEHQKWYAHATPADRAAFDASRLCPKAKVFTAKQFPSMRAWGFFLTLQGETDEVIFGTLPVRHEVKGQCRVYDALQNRDKAIAGIASCGDCQKESTTVERYRLSGNNGVVTEMHLCPRCARWRTIDPMFGLASVEPAPLTSEG